MKIITFDNLPEAVGELLEKFEELQKEVKLLTRPLQEEEYLTLEKAADFLGVTKAALRQNKNIPRILNMRKLYYKKSELKAWLEEGKVAPKPKQVFTAKG